MEYAKTLLWERTLGAEDPEHAIHLERLRASFIQFREHVEPLADDIALSVPDYTDHGIKHCDSLWSTASALIGEDFDLNPAEAFVLGGAFLVHDLGMGLSSYSGGIEEILAMPEFRDALAEVYPEDFAQLLKNAEIDVSADNTWDGLTDPRMKAVLTAFMRNRHADQAAEVVSREWKLSNGQSVYLLADTTLRSFYGECIGMIARSHWLDVAELESALPPSLGHIPGFPPEWTVNPVKVACVLRLADAINIDASRAHPLHTPHRAPRADSRKHWNAQEKMLAAEVRDRRVYFTSGNVFGPELADAWWLLYDSVRLIDSELRRVDNLCADLELPRFSAHAAAGAESPARFARFVRPVGWQPVDARPYIGDQNLVMKQLGGTSLYGSHGKAEVAFREILANAMDATRALKSAFPEANTRPIVVTLKRDSAGDSLSVRDFGIGMRAVDISDSLCNFGTSGWRGAAGRYLPGLVSSGFRPTGKFGIGFFACFMAATRVRVTSRHIEDAKTNTNILEFPHGLDDRPIIRPAQRPEQFLDSGTLVEMHLDVPVDEEDGLFDGEEWPYRNGLGSVDEFARFVRRVALTSDVDIDVRLDGGAICRAVSADQWLTASGEWLLDAMNSSIDLDEEEYAAYRSDFSRTVTPLKSSEGEIVARLSLVSAPLRLRLSGGVRSSRVYIGGVQAEQSSEPFAGVSIGSPESAVRRDARLEIAPDEALEWFAAQAASADPGTLSVPRRIAFRVEALRLGIQKPEWELAWSLSGGAMNDAQLIEWMKSRDRFALLLGSAVKMPPDAGAMLLYESDEDDGRFIVGNDHLVVGDHYRSRNSSWSIRKIDDFVGNDTKSFGWWRHVFDTPIAQVVRCAADAWSVSLKDLVEAVYFDFGESLPGKGEGLLRLRNLAGEHIPIGGWVIERP